MDKIRDILRNHYEKIILTLVLVAVAAAVVYVFQASQREKEKIAKSVEELLILKPQPVPPTDLTNAQAALKLNANPPQFAFPKEHNVLNPVKWKRRPDGQLGKMPTENDIWEKFFITRHIPLRFTAGLDRIPSPGSYYFKIQNEAADYLQYRRPVNVFLKLNETNKYLGRPIVLREIMGLSEKPEQLILEFTDTNERLTISGDTNKPIQRVEGYEVDLRNDFTSQSFTNLRVGSLFKFMSDDYIIVAITENEVVASARATEKNYRIKQFAPPGTITNKVTQAISPPASGAAPPSKPPPPAAATPPPAPKPQ